jgi:hypothetical protein
MNLRTATLQRLLLVVAAALGTTYLALLLPVSRAVLDEDPPIADLRTRLERTILEAGLPRGTDFQSLSNRLNTLRDASDAFAAAVRESLPRLQHPDDVQARLEEPFQLYSFLNESQRRLDEIAALSQAAKVAVTPGLAAGLPAYKQELARPELLWVQLATVQRLVRTAIRAGVREIREVSVDPLPFAEPAEFGPALPPNAAATNPTNRWTVLRVHLTTIGNVDALGRLLLALTLTPEELKRTGLPEDLSGRPALFLDRVLLRRNQLEAAEQAQLDLVVGTVVANEEP